MRSQLLKLFVIVLLSIVGSLYWLSTRKTLTQVNKYKNQSEFGTYLRSSPSLLPEWTLLITGDVIPARTVNQKMVEKNDFFWPLTNIAPILKVPDLTLVNLEAPLIKNCPITNTGFTFCGEYLFAQSLKEAGVDVANLANNHTLNYGWEGLAETERHLKEVGIETTGYTFQTDIWENNAPSPTLTLRGGTNSSPMPPLKLRGGDLPAGKVGEGLYCKKDVYCSKFVVKGVKGMQLGFLGYNAIGQRVDRLVARKQIEKADKLVDILIVSVHWGKEYVREPQADVSLAPDNPQELGKLFVDWGADIVVGNHPHWVQPFEFASFDFAQDKPIRQAQGKDGEDKVIFYALGNTVFDQEWSEETKRGALIKIHFQGKQLVREKTEFIPIGIRDFGQAYLLEGKERQEIEAIFK